MGATLKKKNLYAKEVKKYQTPYREVKLRILFQIYLSLKNISATSNFCFSCFFKSKVAGNFVVS